MAAKVVEPEDAHTESSTGSRNQLLEKRRGGLAATPVPVPGLYPTYQRDSCVPLYPSRRSDSGSLGLALSARVLAVLEHCRMLKGLGCRICMKAQPIDCLVNLFNPLTVFKVIRFRAHPPNRLPQHPLERSVFYPPAATSTSTRARRRI